MAPKKQRILVMPDAAEDLKGIRDPVYSEVVRKLLLLRRFPLLGAPLPPPFSRWRHIPVRMFRIIYRIVPRGIEIAYVRHCKRQMPNLTKADQPEQE